MNLEGAPSCLLLGQSQHQQNGLATQSSQTYCRSTPALYSGDLVARGHGLHATTKGARQQMPACMRISVPVGCKCCGPW